MGVAILALLIGVSAIPAQATVTQAVAKNSTTQADDLTPAEFVKLVRMTQLDLGEPVSVASIYAEKLGPAEYFRFYLMYRATENGWFGPLLSEYAPTATPCSDQQLELQPTFVASLHEPVWCERHQWEAATWLFDTLNGDGGDDGIGSLRRIFLLAHTAGADLSPLEVMAAVTDRYPSIQPRREPLHNSQPPYKSQLPAGADLSTFEGWDAWNVDAPQALLDADVVWFWNQHVRDTPWNPSRIRDLRQPVLANIYTPSSSRYFVGNELRIEGSAGLDFAYDPPDPEAFTGLFVAVNTLILDRGFAGTPWGALDEADVRQFPVLTVNGKRSAGAVLVARNFVLGANARDLPTRVWRTIGAPLFKGDAAAGCPLDQRVLGFALKNIGEANLYASAFLSTIDETNCFDRALQTFSRVLEYEFSTRPDHVIHRYVHVDLDGLPKQPYATGQIAEAPSFLGQALLARWNVAAAERLLLQVRSAELQEAREDLGKYLRDAESLRGRFLTTPTAETTARLSTIFADISAVRDAKKGVRLLVRGSDFAEASTLASALLLGSATSKDTWLIPDRLRVAPYTEVAGTPKFARVWVDEQSTGGADVRVNFLVEMMASATAQAAAGPALRARGMVYSGVATDIECTGIRQSTTTQWKFESISRLDRLRFLVTIRTSEAYLQVLLLQLARPPGLPVQVDWKNSTDPTINSQNYGPIVGAVGLFGVPWINLPIQDGAIVNSTPWPLDVVALVSPSTIVSVDPGLPLASGGKVMLPAQAPPDVSHAATVLDPRGEIPLQDKLSFVPPQWAVLPISFVNTVDTLGGAPVRELTLRVTAIDADGKPVTEAFPLTLGRFGLEDASQIIPLLLPPGFLLRVEGQWRLADGKSEPLASFETDQLEVRIQ